MKTFNPQHWSGTLRKVAKAFSGLAKHIKHSVLTTYGPTEQTEDTRLSVTFPSAPFLGIYGRNRQLRFISESTHAQNARHATTCDAFRTASSETEYVNHWYVPTGRVQRISNGCSLLSNRCCNLQNVRASARKAARNVWGQSPPSHRTSRAGNQKTTKQHFPTICWHIPAALRIFIDIQIT